VTSTAGRTVFVCGLANQRHGRANALGYRRTKSTTAEETTLAAPECAQAAITIGDFIMVWRGAQTATARQRQPHDSGEVVPPPALLENAPMLT